ncbi:hypothetical protein SDJN03_17395, partial [Cucurbita argyrosperma subsp. sororia]
MANTIKTLLLIISSIYFFIQLSSAATYNVITYGAKPDGKTDSTRPFLKAWTSACTSSTPSTINVPKGRFLLNPTTFRGPCKNKITFRLNGTLVAPLDYRALGSSGYWILFIKVNDVSFFGGNIDAKGASYWACRDSGKDCPPGARSLTFNWANNIYLSGLTSLNSRQSHITINSCNNVLVKNVKIMAPDQSPNTDGIHVQSSTDVTITGTTIQTGDDCISIGDGTKNLFMTHIKCGPGHGSAGVKISDVTYKNIGGTSATLEAITFDCSSTKPCDDIRLEDIKLTYKNKAPTSTCNNVGGSSMGILMPQSCL